MYDEINEDTRDNYTIYEYWDEESCWSFRRKSGETLEDGLFHYNTFMVPDTGDFTAEYRHEFGEVPFIPFSNNNTNTNDLKNIKPLIDVYDKVYSGFVNDLDDIQELIIALSGYGGTDLNTFLSDLKKYKTIQLDADEGSNPEVSTLNIEIPIEARNSVLEATRKAIFEQRQGFDPQPENFGNQSGEALKFMYSLLEMKAGLTETEFQLGFVRMVRAIYRHEGIDCKKIIQTWPRTCVKNDTEQAQICKDSVGIVSKKTILKNHPLVEDADAELKQLEKEALETQERFWQLEESQHDMSVQTVQEIEQEFRRAEQALDGKINAWYQRFASNNGISMVKDRRLLNSDELEEFQWDGQDYIKYGRENGINQQWEKQLENASAKVHISRLEALKVQTQQEIEKLYGNYHDFIDEHIASVYTSGYYHTAYEVQRGVLVGWQMQSLTRKKSATSYISLGRWMNVTSRTASGWIKQS